MVLKQNCFIEIITLQREGEKNMTVKYRKYNNIEDYSLICNFLENTYLTYNTKFDNSLPLFEFQCALSRGMSDTNKSIDEALKNIILWFLDDELVGINEEDSFCVSSEQRYLFDEMIQVRERLNDKNLTDIEWTIYDGDTDFEKSLLSREYYRTEEYWVRRDMDLSNIIESTELPDGFHIVEAFNYSSREELHKAYKFCYGILFNKNVLDNFHNTSTYRKELDLIVLGPDKNVIALCSGRYDDKNKMVTIEAVSCYHDYRGRGISKALQLHWLSNAKKLGAKKATVFTAMPEKYPAPNRLYESVGFDLVGNLFVWKKNVKNSL